MLVTQCDRDTCRRIGRLRGRSARLVLASLVVGVVWLWLLPILSRLPGVAGVIRRNEQWSVDPSAAFYTELDPTVFRKPSGDDSHHGTNQRSANSAGPTR